MNQTLSQLISKGEDVLTLSNVFKIDAMTTCGGGKDRFNNPMIWYNFQITPVTPSKGIQKYIQSSIAESRIISMNKPQYDKNFVTNSDIVGQNIQLTFAIPHKFFQGDSCKSKIRDVELRNVYTSEVTIEKPFTLLRIVPDYSSIHREGYGFKTHYNLTMVFEESHTFYQIKILLNSQRGEYSEHGFPKRRLPLELRQFNFLN